MSKVSAGLWASLQHVNMKLKGSWLRYTAAPLVVWTGLKSCWSLYHWLTADGGSLWKHSFITSAVSLLFSSAGDLCQSGEKGGGVERISCVLMIQRGWSSTISWWVERLWLGRVTGRWSGEESFIQQWLTDQSQQVEMTVSAAVWTALRSAPLSSPASSLCSSGCDRVSSVYLDCSAASAKEPSR